MAETQVIFRLDSELAGRLDRTLRKMGFRTRSEWFRRQVQETLKEAERRQALKRLRKFTVPGITERQVQDMVRGWRQDARRTR